MNVVTQDNCHSFQLNQFPNDSKEVTAFILIIIFGFHSLQLFTHSLT